LASATACSQSTRSTRSGTRASEVASAALYGCCRSGILFGCAVATEATEATKGGLLSLFALWSLLRIISRYLFTAGPSRSRTKFVYGVRRFPCARTLLAAGSATGARPHRFGPQTDGAQRGPGCQSGSFQPVRRRLGPGRFRPRPGLPGDRQICAPPKPRCIPRRRGLLLDALCQSR